MRVLYCTGGGVGNVVMSTPAIAALHEMGHEVDVWLEPGTPEGVADLLRGFGAIRGVLHGKPPLLDEYVHVVHSVWSRTRLGHRSELFAPNDPGMLCRRSESAVNMCPIRNALGYTGPTPPAHVEVGPLPPALVDACPPGEYIVCAPGCKQEGFWRRKRWHGWKELAPRLCAPLVWLGCEGDNPCDEPLGHDLCGHTTLAEATSIIAGAKAIVAIDNGLAHVAAALGVPTVVMFGATSETKNRPLGPSVRVLTRDLNCRPCQMTPRWELCGAGLGWTCMDFEHDDVVSAVTALTAAHTEEAR